SRLVALHPDVDLAAARQPDVPRLLVGDAEVQQLRLAPAQDLLRDLDDSALDAAAGHRAGHLAAGADRHLRARRARRGPLDADHHRERDLVAARGPGVDIGQHVPHRENLLWNPPPTTVEQWRAVIRVLLRAVARARPASAVSCRP